jgi:hypothetical protein
VRDRRLREQHGDRCFGRRRDDGVSEPDADSAAGASIAVTDREPFAENERDGDSNRDTDGDGVAHRALFPKPYSVVNEPIA